MTTQVNAEPYRLPFYPARRPDCTALIVIKPMLPRSVGRRAGCGDLARPRDAGKNAIS
jgi:hypothetical protein